MEWYEKIKELRIKQGLSMDELAKRSGYSGRSAIWNIEQGHRNISSLKLQDIATALGVSPKDFFFTSDELAINNEKEKLFDTINSIDNFELLKQLNEALDTIKNKAAK